MATLSFPIALMLRGFGPQVDLNTSEVTGTLGAANGGTGVANNAAATLTRSGSHALTITTTGTTGITFPTTGTLATLAGSEALSGKTYNGNTWTAGTGTLTIAAAKTATINNTLTLSGTDGSTLAVGTGGTLGTAAYTASTAYDVAGAAAAVTPTTLGLVIGTNVQAYDADLTTWAGTTPGTGVATALAGAVVGNGTSVASALAAAAYTPALAFGGSSVGITYGTQAGRWSKVGNRIFFDFRVTLSSKGAQTGTATLSLPAAVKSGIGAPAFTVGYCDALAVGVVVPLVAIGTSGSGDINLYKMVTGAMTTITDTDFTNTSDLIISGSYEY